MSASGGGKRRVSTRFGLCFASVYLYGPSNACRLLTGKLRACTSGAQAGGRTGPLLRHGVLRLREPLQDAETGAKPAVLGVQALVGILESAGLVKMYGFEAALLAFSLVSLHATSQIRSYMEE
eukprot:scaffold346268_cov34-Prasinocladus_malaysianus.AAC.1